ncbi:putative DE-cadherin isoform X1 [Sesbania bispinosa]|nr:putative DE-cadherin isoform X1 [Sesbania bispinosa]
MNITIRRKYHGTEATKSINVDLVSFPSNPPPFALFCKLPLTWEDQEHEKHISGASEGLAITQCYFHNVVMSFKPQITGEAENGDTHKCLQMLKTYRAIIKSDQLLRPVVAQPGCMSFRRTKTSDPYLTNSLWKFDFMAFGRWWHNLGAVVSLAQKNRSEEERKQHDAREEKKRLHARSGRGRSRLFYWGHRGSRNDEEVF